MNLMKRSDYGKELSKLEETLKHQKLYYEKTISTVARIDKDVDYGIRHFNSDNAEQFNELVINTMVQSSLKNKIKDLAKSMSKPYFARVDFKDEESTEEEEYYIGKTSLINGETQELLVVDWRAPVANLYYEGRIGEANYVCPDGDIQGEITLKRQYKIENGRLDDYFDIDITTNDDFLQACLGANADNRLKDIVSTIQAEQNQVIRADMWKPLIVQGAAGGGKTTIALHRIAYLIYTFEKSFKPENFMIIAPNRFFLNYISDVLPELGVDKVRQTTYEDFARMILGKKLKIRDGYLKLSRIVNDSCEDKQDEVNRIKNISNFKSSLKFKDVIEEYLYELEDNFLPECDFKIYKFKLISRENLMKLFKEEYGHLPYKKRIDEMKKHLNNVLKRNKGKLLDKIETLFDEKLDELRHKMEDSPKRRSLFIKYTGERDALLQRIDKESKTLVKSYISKINYDNIEVYYKNSLEKLLEVEDVDDEILLESYNSTANSINESLYEIEDLAPLLLLKHRIFGLSEKIDVKHIVIDEAQDFSLFQLYMLKKITGSSSMTILGDLCQGINSYRGIENWNDVLQDIFTGRKGTFLNLDQSYRTTTEILEKASEVIGKLEDENLPAAKPVLRHGEPVHIQEMDGWKDTCLKIKENIQHMKDKGFGSMAIIGKTLNECKYIRKELKKHGCDIHLIDGSDKKYDGGIAIIPSYLVKGLEFDMVVVANASKKMYTMTPMDVKLLYVALTRPLHELNIYSVGSMSELLMDS